MKRMNSLHVFAFMLVVSLLTVTWGMLEVVGMIIDRHSDMVR